MISSALLFTVVGVPLGVFGLLSFAGMLIYLWILTPILLNLLALGVAAKAKWGVMKEWR